jgi:hypothetical protein
MAFNRSVWMLAFLAALAVVASAAHAKPVKEQPKPADGAPMNVDSPIIATSVRDWHPELDAATTRSAPTTPTTSCTCGKTVTQTATTRQTATSTQTASTTTPAGQRGNGGRRSAKPLERAQEVPLESIPR